MRGDFVALRGNVRALRAGKRFLRYDLNRAWGFGGPADEGDRRFGETGSLGVVGVIGPQRMDYGRVIPLVSYCAELVTRKLLA